MLLVLFAYGPALFGDFVNIDDTHYLSKNRAVTHTASPIHFWIHPPDNDFWWPVTYSSLWFLWHASGGSPVAFHFASALLHALNASLFYFVLGRYRSERGWRLLAAALFAVHPVHAPAIAWIFQHKTVLSTTLFLFAFLAYQRSDDSSLAYRVRGLHRAASIALFALAALAKTSTIMFPACLLLHHALTRTIDLQPALRRVVPHTIVALVLASVTALVNTNFLKSGRLTGVFWHPSALERLLVSAKNFWFYAGKLLVPRGYAFIYPWESADPHRLVAYVPLAGVLIAVGTVFVSVRKWCAYLPWAAGLSFYSLNLIPVLGFASTPYMRYSLVADHYQYLASLGLFPAVGAGLSRLAVQSWRTVHAIFLIAIIFGLALFTRTRARAFENSETLWRAAISENPTSDLAYYNLGVYLGEQKRTTEAVELYRKALTINPKKVEAHVNLGKVLLEGGDLRGAESEYLAALTTDPNWASAHYGLGVLRQNQSRLSEALESYDHALMVNPRLTDAWSNKCLILVETERFAEAEVACKRTLAIDPLHRAALTNLGALFLRTQRLSEALPVHQQLLNLEPTNPKLHLKVAKLAGYLGNVTLARKELREALELDPHNPEADRLLRQLGPQ
jgi:tetratricopeptide (TPR) repeat protein